MNILIYVRSHSPVSPAQAQAEEGGALSGDLGLVLVTTIILITVALTLLYVRLIQDFKGFPLSFYQKLHIYEMIMASFTGTGEVTTTELTS